MGAKSSGAKSLAGVIALAAGFAVATLQPSLSLAAACGGDSGSGCIAAGAGKGDHDANFSPPSS